MNSLVRLKNILHNEIFLVFTFNTAIGVTYAETCNGSIEYSVSISTQSYFSENNNKYISFPKIKSINYRLSPTIKYSDEYIRDVVVKTKNRIEDTCRFFDNNFELLNNITIPNCDNRISANVINISFDSSYNKLITWVDNFQYTSTSDGIATIGMSGDVVGGNIEELISGLTNQIVQASDYVQSIKEFVEKEVETYKKLHSSYIFKKNFPKRVDIVYDVDQTKPFINVNKWFILIKLNKHCEINTAMIKEELDYFLNGIKNNKKQNIKVRKLI